MVGRGSGMRRKYKLRRFRVPTTRLMSPRAVRTLWSRTCRGYQIGVGMQSEHVLTA